VRELPEDEGGVEGEEEGGSMSTHESSLLESQDEDTEEWRRRRRRRRRKRDPLTRGIESSDLEGLSSSTAPEERTATEGEGGEKWDFMAEMAKAVEGGRLKRKTEAGSEKEGLAGGNQRWSRRIRAASVGLSVASGVDDSSGVVEASGGVARTRASSASRSRQLSSSGRREDSVGRTGKSRVGAERSSDGVRDVDADLLQDSEMSSGWVGGVSESELSRSSVASVGAVRRRRGRNAGDDEPKVYGGGYLRPEKAEWSAPCDMIGCDGVQCKEFHKWEKRHDKWRIGQLVRTPDGDGEVVDKDVSARPLRVRLSDGMEGWYTWKEVKDLAKIRSRKKLSSSLFGFGAASTGPDSEALSQSGAEDSLASAALECNAGGDGQEETLAQYAATSQAEAMRDSYGPYAGLFEDGGELRQSIQDLERECGIKDLQIRLWPAEAESLNVSEAARLKREGIGQFDTPRHCECARHRGGRGDCVLRNGVCLYAAPAPWGDERGEDWDAFRTGWGGGGDAHDGDRGVGMECGGGLGRGEDPWAETCDGRGRKTRWGNLLTLHHTYYVTSSYIQCHIIIHTMSHHHTNQVGQSSDAASYILCHIIIHTMSHHHTYYVTSSYKPGGAIF